MKTADNRENKHEAYAVYLDGEQIDTVFYAGYDSPDEVKRSLIDHDGYSPAIIVKKEG